ncbi:MAG TPA: SpoIIE family protein phosphatase [Acidimicrobiia bacterium]|nr:SpoIIE family protein phosphatase [Acidimicrobiia bacterium]
MILPPPSDERFYTALVDDDPHELYEDAPCAYLSTQADGTIAKVNRTFLRWTGYDSASLVGRVRFQDLLAPGDRILYETHFDPLLRMQGAVREVAVDVVVRSGGLLPVLVWSALRQDGTGEPAMIRTALFDATERRAYERELLAARKQAESAEAQATALARTLQESFLPPVLEKVPGLDIGGGYRPAGDGSEVGGDFYDVFPIGEGEWAVVLGDVCGKGAAAAALTALARYTVRAEALRTAQPGAVLERLHEALLRYRPSDFCTAVFATLEPTASGFRFAVASGGHPLPLRHRSDGQIETLGTTGRLLGIVEGAARRETTVALSPGDTVVLYTDGITEAPRDGELFGDERLRALVDETADEPAEVIADRIVAAALDFQQGHSRDDIAVLVIKVE